MWRGHTLLQNCAESASDPQPLHSMLSSEQNRDTISYLRQITSSLEQCFSVNPRLICPSVSLVVTQSERASSSAPCCCSFSNTPSGKSKPLSCPFWLGPGDAISFLKRDSGQTFWVPIKGPQLSRTSCCTYLTYCLCS